MATATWTPEVEKKLRNLKEKAWSYTWIHRENSIYLNDIYEWVSIIAYSLSFFNGIIMIFPTNLIYIRIFNILLSFGAGLLVFYIKNKNLMEAGERHKIASSKFSSIYNNIDRQLSMDVSQREHPLHYHRWITLQYDTLYGSAPDIDPPIIDEYIRKFARRRKINPIEAAEFDRSEGSDDSNDKPARAAQRNKELEIDLESDDDDNLQEVIVVGGTTDEMPKGDFEDSETLSSPVVPIPSKEDLKESKEDLKDSKEEEVKKSRRHHRKRDLKQLSKHLDSTPANISPPSQRHLDYELSRFEMNMSGMNNMNVNSRCLIPEYEFRGPQIPLTEEEMKKKKDS